GGRRKVAIVVDSMAIERQRGIAEQEDLVGPNLTGPARRLRSATWLGNRLSWLRIVSVDDVLVLNQREASATADAVAHFDENQRTRTSFFIGHILDARQPGHRISHA